MTLPIVADTGEFVDAAFSTLRSSEYAVE